MIDKPLERIDGTCSACIGGWQCKYHQIEGVKADKRKAVIVAQACQNMREINNFRYAAKMELESDEAGTACEKAKRTLLNK